MSQGTLTDTLQRLLPFFEPVYQAIIQHNQNASHWHTDETRWMVFSQVEGKIGYRWYLFFRACALNASTSPEDLSDFLPWHMGDARKEILKLPPASHDTS